MRTIKIAAAWLFMSLSVSGQIIKPKLGTAATTAATDYATAAQGTKADTAVQFSTLPAESVMPSLRAWLRGPVSVATLGVVGDSVSSGAGTWTRLLASKIAGLYPDVTVKTYDWTTGTPNKMVPTIVQTGSSGAYYFEAKSQAGGSEVNFSAPITTGQMFSGDLDVRLKVACADWTPSTVIYLYDCSNWASQSAFALRLESDGKLQLRWSTTSGLANPDLGQISSVATGLTDGSTKWVRAVLDVNNDAGQYAVKFYLSDDGNTWTQLGTTKTGATGVTTLASTWDSRICLGGQSVCPTSVRWYDAEVRNGIDGQIMTPPISEWRANIASRANYGGSRELRIYCACQPGALSGYWSTAFLQTALPYCTTQIFHVLGHNDYGGGWGYLSVPQIKAIDFDPLLARIATACPNRSVVVMTENPVASTYADKQPWQGIRWCSLLQIAEMESLKTLDVYSTMIDAGFVDGWTSDGIHMTPTGYQKWADIVHNSIFTVSRIP
jgi:hypothetical protein